MKTIKLNSKNLDESVEKAAAVLKKDCIVERYEMVTKIAVFNGREIRKTIHNNEWWFVINDIIQSLTDSVNPADYYKKLKKRDAELSELIGKGGGQIVPPLGVLYPSPDPVCASSSSNRKGRRNPSGRR